MSTKQYGRLTFLPAGASRKRTVWAIETTKSDSKWRRTFLVCDKEGETEKAVRQRNATTGEMQDIDQQEMIVCHKDEVVWKPAYMSLKYGWLVEGVAPSSGTDY